ncbi:unannotated protein [freshwater metagenome]|uniref:Unannotated protein n=1 Tax=freshwater metagenome TaxID=449393 RepID=A0A6J6DDX0_9ZZZZ
MSNTFSTHAFESVHSVSVVADEIETVRYLTIYGFEHIFETEIRTRSSRPRAGSGISTS